MEAAQEHVAGLVLIWLTIALPVMCWLLWHRKWPSLGRLRGAASWLATGADPRREWQLSDANAANAKADLIAENALLRHQLALLYRQSKWPRLTTNESSIGGTVTFRWTVQAGEIDHRASLGILQIHECRESKHVRRSTLSRG